MPLVVCYDRHLLFPSILTKPKPIAYLTINELGGGLFWGAGENGFKIINYVRVPILRLWDLGFSSKSNLGAWSHLELPSCIETCATQQIGESLLTSLFTFFRICIPYLIEAVAVYKSSIQKLKELIKLSNFCNFQLFASSIEGKYQPSKTAKLLGGKKVNEPYIPPWNFEFLQENSMYWAKIFSEN